MPKETCDDDEFPAAASLEQSPCPSPIQMDETVIGRVPETSSNDNQRQNNLSDLAILRSLLPLMIRKRKSNESPVHRRRPLSR
jgi:hypothetical protein